RLDLRDQSGQRVDRLPAHGRVDLDREAQSARLAENPHRLAMRAAHAPEGVVGVGGGAVEADREPVEPGITEGSELLRRRGAGPARGERHGHAAPARVRDQIDDVRSPKRVAAGEHEERRRGAESGDAIDQAIPFLGRQLLRMALRDRRGPTVDAGERAGPGRLPDHDERRAGEAGHRRAAATGDGARRRPGPGSTWRRVRPSATANTTDPEATATLAAATAGRLPLEIARARASVPPARST